MTDCHRKDPHKARLDRMYDRLVELEITEAELARRLYGPDAPQSRVNNWRRRGRIPYEEIPRVAEVLGMTFDALYYGEDRRVGQVRDGDGIGLLYSTTHWGEQAYIPLLTYKEADAWQDALEQFRSGDLRQRISVDASIGARAHSFALRVEGDAMQREYREGDLVVIDPQEDVRPGDYVAAKTDDGVVLRKYRERGRDADGLLIYELKPINDDYPVLEFRGDPGDRIIGPVVEHRRRFRR